MRIELVQRCVVLGMLGATALTAHAQLLCDRVWLAESPSPGIIAGRVEALAALPTGGAVAGGTFATASGAALLARWDASGWTALGPTLSGAAPIVHAVAVLTDGSIVAGGSFAAPAPGSANIARWDGAAWQPVGSGLNGRVLALLALPDGSFVAGGEFLFSGSQALARVARWNGAQWSPLGAGFDNAVHALALAPDGALLAGGAFTTSGSASVLRVARWDGAQWQALGEGTNDTVLTLLAEADGSVWAGGRFTLAGNAPAARVARWDGAAWHALSVGITPFNGDDPEVRALLRTPDGGLLVGGRFQRAGGAAARAIARWDGLQWSPLGDGVQTQNLTPGEVFALAPVESDQAGVGGAFTRAGGAPSRGFARLGYGVPPPRVLTIFGGGVVCPGSQASFALEVAGEAPITFAWRRNSVLLDPLLNPSAEQAVLVLPEVSAADDGWYDCVVTNRCGSVLSGRVRLIVRNEPELCAPTSDCDSVDFNNDDVFPDDQDLQDFVRVLGGGDCPACNDPDFNNDGVFPDDADLAAFLIVLGGGSC